MPSKRKTEPALEVRLPGGTTLSGGSHSHNRPRTHDFKGVSLTQGGGKLARLCNVRLKVTNLRDDLSPDGRATIEPKAGANLEDAS